VGHGEGELLLRDVDQEVHVLVRLEARVGCRLGGQDHEVARAAFLEQLELRMHDVVHRPGSDAAALRLEYVPPDPAEPGRALHEPAAARIPSEPEAERPARPNAPQASEHGDVAQPQ
jgi:hypothetical protein